MKKLLIPILAAVLAAPALAAPAPPAEGTRGEEVRIPFPRFRLRDFKAEPPEIVYLQDRGRNWYRAEIIGPCLDLPWAQAIGIDTRGWSSFDRFSSIVVRGERCQLTSLTRSAGPPRKAGKRRS